MVESLRSKTLRAISWSFLESVGLQGMRFVVGIVLARLLFPEQFGLIGMLTVFIAVAQCFLDGGFGAALIQKREPTQTDISSIFYFNILVGLSAAGLLCLIAPRIAAFYDQPILTPLTRALSLTIVINAFGMIQNTLLTKRINFKTQTIASLISGGLSAALAITLATGGFGVWSLAIQQISATFFHTLLLWVLNPWRPALVFSVRSLREMFGFGSRMLASSLLNQTFGHIHLIAIGKLFSATDLGFFMRAESLEKFPSQTLSGMLGRVTFPVFSAIQDDPARLKKALEKALTFSVLLNFPMMIGLGVIAHPLVMLLLTERWADSIPYLQLFCILELQFPVHLINLNVLQALGRSDLFLRLEILKKILVIINLAVTWRWGISAMIYGMIFFSVIFYFLNSYYTGVLAGYPMREQIRHLSPYLLMAVIMGGGVYLAGLLLFPNYWLMLIVQIPMGVFIYIFLCWHFRLAAFMEIWKASLNKMSWGGSGIIPLKLKRLIVSHKG
jgi:O-antigen/teichoic acid export membrane protein